MKSTCYQIHSHASCCGTILSSTFTGKEKDSESGYHYFGARYYDCEALTGWLSVDPMMDKHPSISSYNYYAWNPVMMVDPDGMDFDPTMEKYVSNVERYCDILIRNLPRTGFQTEDQTNLLTELQNTKDEIQKMREDKSTYYCMQTASFGKEGGTTKGITQYYGCGDITRKGEKQHWIMVSLNIDGGFFTDEGELNRKGLQVLAHELKHCYQFYNKEMMYVQLANEDGFKEYNTQELEMAAFNRGAALGSFDRFDIEHYPNLYIGTMDQFIKDNPGCKAIKHR